jgi:hypothetical protein
MLLIHVFVWNTAGSTKRTSLVRSKLQVWLLISFILINTNLRKLYSDVRKYLLLDNWTYIYLNLV